MDQAGSGLVAGDEATLRRQGFATDQLLEQGFPFPHRHHRALGQLAPQLLIKDTHRSTTEHGGGLGLEAAGPAQPPAHQGQVAPELPIERGHQAQATEGTPQAPQWIARIEHLKGVLQGIAAAAIHRRIDLDVAPGEHQQGGPKCGDHLQQHPLHIQHGHGRQIQDPLAQLGELFVQVIGQIDRPDREDGIAGQPHQQHPVVACGAHSSRPPGPLGPRR